ncbi:uncharacterized protein, partial [Montipora capricornis]|uniref:uncharacterized protein n=1 Tax=Montipora capricornis TaxID=246305 RepID=UPI0035F19603
MSRLKKSGKRSGTTASVTDHDEEASSCIICLERVSCRGKLSVCNHWFCFPCILEWAENTNTCPICKARFRCITKIHVSPFKSPPTKVRVGDKDQRVWNDDDDLVAEDVLDAIDSDDHDDDYEPPYHMENPWTRSSRNRERQQESNVRYLTGTSRQPELDQYDLEDSFIDDTDEALQAYLYSAYSRDDDFDGHDSNLDCEKIDTDDDDGSDAEDSDVEILPSRVSPYALRNKQIIHRRSSRSTINSFVSLSQVTGEQACLSPASTDSFIVSDESADELNTDWVPFGNHDKNSRTKKKKDCVTNRKQGSKERQASPKSQSRCVKSKRLKKQQEPVQGRMCKSRSQ